MSEYDDPFESPQLDLSSEPTWPPADGSNASRKSDKKTAGWYSAYPRIQKVKLYFGCCKVFAYLTPPEHVLQGKADIWRTHCPRCARMTEIMFE